MVIWYSADGNSTHFDKILSDIREYIQRGGRVYVGTDSFITKFSSVFASAVCLVGVKGENRYFFSKESLNKGDFNTLANRMVEEVRRSVEIADDMSRIGGISTENIEIHIDVSPFGAKQPTSKFAVMLSGYARGAGYGCKVKPDSWAAASVADRHSK